MRIFQYEVYREDLEKSFEVRARNHDAAAAWASLFIDNETTIHVISPAPKRIDYRVGPRHRPIRLGEIAQIDKKRIERYVC